MSRLASTGLKSSTLMVKGHNGAPEQATASCWPAAATLRQRRPTMDCGSLAAACCSLAAACCSLAVASQRRLLLARWGCWQPGVATKLWRWHSRAAAPL